MLVFEKGSCIYGTVEIQLPVVLTGETQERFHSDEHCSSHLGL